jgi:hypothetical protein
LTRFSSQRRFNEPIKLAHARSAGESLLQVRRDQL